MIDGDYALAPNIGNSAKTVDEARGAKIRDYVSKIVFPGGIEYEALASDAGTAQGRTPSLIIADEFHAWLKRDPRELWGAMRAGAAKVANSLTVVTTTAGPFNPRLRTPCSPPCRTRPPASRSPSP